MKKADLLVGVDVGGTFTDVFVYASCMFAASYICLIFEFVLHLNTIY